MEMADLRGIATILCMVGFLAVVWWAYGPSRKAYFERAANIPFTGDDAKTGVEDTVSGGGTDE